MFARIFLLAIVALGIAWYACALGRMYRTDRGLFLSHILNDWHDRRFAAFHRLFFRIELGMTRDQVMQTIAKVYPTEGRRKRPRLWVDEATQIILFMDPEWSPEPNCEGIFLTISTNGRIVKKGYGVH